MTRTRSLAAPVADRAAPIGSPGGASVLCTRSSRILGTILALADLHRHPMVPHQHLFDPFFISRPSLVDRRSSTNGHSALRRGFLWPHLVSTVGATMLGLVVAVVTGFFVGLGLSQNRLLAAVFNPFIVALNSLPRIAMVPLITMIFGLGLASKVVTAWFIVFFLMFFNAFKGGVSIEQHLIDFCRTLGGSNRADHVTRPDSQFARLDVRRTAQCGVVLADRRGDRGVRRIDDRHGLSDRHRRSRP